MSLRPPSSYPGHPVEASGQVPSSAGMFRIKSDSSSSSALSSKAPVLPSAGPEGLGQSSAALCLPPTSQHWCWGGQTRGEAGHVASTDCGGQEGSCQSPTWPCSPSTLATLAVCLLGRQVSSGRTGFEATEVWSQALHLPYYNGYVIFTFESQLLCL
jgi:hypothetical protein